MSTLILSPAEAGKELNITELAVRRLIARGRLPATVLGNGAQGITPAALQEYVANGAPDLAMPDFADRNSVRLADRFWDAVRQEAQEQVPANEALAEEWRKLIREVPPRTVKIQGAEVLQPGRPALLPTQAREQLNTERRITVTPKIRELIASPPPTSIFSVPATDQELAARFGNWGTLALVHGLRDEEQRLPEADAKRESLYSSPAAYAARAALSLKSLRDRRVVVFHRSAGPGGPTVWVSLLGADVIDALPGGSGGGSSAEINLIARTRAKNRGISEEAARLELVAEGHHAPAEVLGDRAGRLLALAF